MKNDPNKISARWVKDNISMVDLLANLGFAPLRPAGKERLYVSMLRDSDTTPSFSVDEKAGTWFDHGEGKGGNIIDFGLQYWRGLSFPEVLEKIVAVSNSKPPIEPQRFARQEKIKREPNYGIQQIKDLGNNPALSNYLQSRGVRLAAEGRAKEVYYYVEDENKIRTNYFATGWLNDRGAWEVRNRNFKGCLGQKAVSFIPNSEKRLAVFEGYFNYLSWLTDNPFATESVLVLNSLSLLQPGILKAQDFRDLALYFDNDTSGRQATKDFIAAIPCARDCAGIYTGYNDYNDLIIAERTGYQMGR